MTYQDNLKEMMILRKLVTVFCLFQLTLAKEDRVQGYDYEEPLLYDTFPDGFVWGAATAAYQVSFTFKRGTKNYCRGPSLLDGYLITPM